MNFEKEIGKIQEADLKAREAAVAKDAKQNERDVKQDERIGALEAQLGRAAQVGATPGATLDINPQCRHKYTIGSMATPGSDAEKEAVAEKEAQDCPTCVQKKRQAKARADGKRKLEGREVDEDALTTQG